MPAGALSRLREPLAALSFIDLRRPCFLLPSRAADDADERVLLRRELSAGFWDDAATESSGAAPLTEAEAEASRVKRAEELSALEAGRLRYDERPEDDEASRELLRRRGCLPVADALPDALALPYVTRLGLELSVPEEAWLRLLESSERREPLEAEEADFRLKLDAMFLPYLVLRELDQACDLARCRIAVVDDEVGVDV